LNVDRNYPKKPSQVPKYPAINMVKQQQRYFWATYKNNQQAAIRKISSGNSGITHNVEHG